MPRPRSPRTIVRVTLDLPPELVARLDAYCAEVRRTRREVVIECLSEWLDRHSDPNGQRPD